jgi:type I restriction enzyme, S subunit
MSEGGRKKVNNEEGIVKSEWKEFQLGDVVDIFDGPHATPIKTKKGSIFLGISNLVNGRIDLVNVEYLSVDDYHKWTRRVEPRENDIVFSYETKLGDAALVPRGLRFCLGRRMGLLRSRNNLIDPKFLLALPVSVCNIKIPYPDRRSEIGLPYESVPCS